MFMGTQSRRRGCRRDEDISDTETFRKECSGMRTGVALGCKENQRGESAQEADCGGLEAMSQSPVHALLLRATLRR